MHRPRITLLGEPGSASAVRHSIHLFLWLILLWLNLLRLWLRHHGRRGRRDDHSTADNSRGWWAITGHHADGDWCCHIATAAACNWGGNRATGATAGSCGVAMAATAGELGLQPVHQARALATAVLCCNRATRATAHWRCNRHACATAGWGRSHNPGTVAATMARATQQTEGCRVATGGGCHHEYHRIHSSTPDSGTDDQNDNGRNACCETFSQQPKSDPSQDCVQFGLVG